MLFGLSKMLHASARPWVDESVIIPGASTSKRVAELAQTLEAKSCATLSAYHLVALGLLGSLMLDILLGDHHFASRALLGSNFRHPPAKAILTIIRFPLLLGCMLLTCQTTVIWLSSTSEARDLLAQRTLHARSHAFLQCDSHGAIWRWTCAQIFYRSDGLLQTAGKHPL
jgi:hypothetical protein